MFNKSKHDHIYAVNNQYAVQKFVIFHRLCGHPAAKPGGTASATSLIPSSHIK